MKNRAPFLLTMPTYGGSLAAIRSLGERGVKVTVAGEHFLAPARWSRYAARWKETPPVADSKAYLNWLLDFGRTEPGHVLYPTSDDLAFLFAANAEALSKYFLLYQPPVKSLVRVLDKRELHDACEAVGLDTVPTWCPQTEEEVERLARDVKVPLLIKARTQVMRLKQTKGLVIDKREELVDAWKRFVADDRYVKGIEQFFGPVTKPMVQEYFPRGAERVYSVTGFIDESGDLFDARAAVKVLQRTRPVGLGLCFEAAPLDEELTRKVASLCRKLGHFGVFEVEFVRDGDRKMVIDYNPRFYGQMGFDAARGLPLAYLCYLGACGDKAALRAALGESRHRAHGGPSIYTHRFVFELLLVAQRLGGTMSSQERRHWSDWYAKHRDSAADASASARDWLPGVVHAAAEVWPGVRALKKVVRRSRPPEAPGAQVHACSAEPEVSAVSAE